ncbi:hypothetical protein E3P96_02647 [Wallemia ichthyophaga]|nr:hypothetical protein E3P96_02647 [Wallemia ichthyophaga]
MGSNLSKALSSLWKTKELRLLMLGLDAAGKTTILYKLKLNQSVTTIPTVGFNVETVTYKNVKFTFGMLVDKTKSDHYGGITIQEARQELHRILGDREMRDCLLLVFANKQDLPGAMSPAEVTEKLGLHKMRERSWYVHPSCATTGEGLFEGGLIRVRAESADKAQDCLGYLPTSKSAHNNIRKIAHYNAIQCNWIQYRLPALSSLPIMLTLIRTLLI